MKPLVRRMIDIRRRRDTSWERLSQQARYMMNRAVSSAHKDCLDAGLAQEANDAIREYEGDRL